MAAYREPMTMNNNNMEARWPSAEEHSNSTWHSPVPYLFGGLAAMLGLIAFALLILACSYWKLSGYLEEGEGDIESGQPKSQETQKAATPSAYEEKFLVIQPGHNNPTLIATPALPFTTNATCTCTNSQKSLEMPHNTLKPDMDHTQTPQPA